MAGPTSSSAPGAARDSETPLRHLSITSDDDDMDYDPRVNEDDEEEFFETEEQDSDDEQDSETDYQEAAEDQELEIELSLAPDDGTGNGDTIEDVRVRQSNGAPTAIRVSPTQIIQLLGNVGFRRLLASHNIVGGSDDDDGDDEDDENAPLGLSRFGRRWRRPRGSKPNYPPVPSPEGQELMASGTFGANQTYQDTLRERKKALARKLMARELDNDRRAPTEHTSALSQDMIPSSEADNIIYYDQRCYSGQFSDDGNFFFSCSQDFVVRMYDTSNPYNWKHYKSVDYPFPQWTITDATLSPDNKYLAYTSIRSMVCLAPTDPSITHEPYILEFANMTNRSRRTWGTSSFGIWSIRFSGDGRELVAGTGNDSVYVYDIDQNKTILRIQGHQDDVNAVCFGDKNSPHILYSGSDDTLIKVWDRRSMRDNRAAGVFVGHTEGLTYVDSKGDGRYVLSNGKDQTMKLWDLRKMMSTDQSDTIDPRQFGTGFDYRFMNYSDAEYEPHPHDCSVVTFRGHRVLKTLIRCHFSPPGSTNSRYVYTGSEDGKVHIYNLDATVAGKIDVQAATRNTRPQSSATLPRYYQDENECQTWKTCVRDASWHPNIPMVAATSWNGWGSGMGTCTVHSWHDGPPEDESGIDVGRRVDSQMHERPDLYESGVPSRGGLRTRLRSQRVQRAGNDDDEW